MAVRINSAYDAARYYASRTTKSTSAKSTSSAAKSSSSAKSSAAANASRYVKTFSKFQNEDTLCIALFMRRLYCNKLVILKTSSVYDKISCALRLSAN